MTSKSDQALAEYGSGTTHQPAPLWLRLMPLLVLIAAVALAIGLTMLGEKPAEKPEPEAARLVDVVTVEPADITYTVDSQGTVEPHTQTTLVPQVAGNIVEVSDNFVAGGFVEAGSTLLRIDPSDYETALASAQADLANARAQLSEEQARADQARRDWDNRYGDSDREANPLVLRKPQVAQARAQVRAAEAAVARARRDLERTRINVPYAGIVRSRDADLGQYVTSGTQLGEVFAVKFAEVRLPLTDSDLAYLTLPQINAGSDIQPVPVELSASVGGKERQWAGQIVRTEGTVNQESRVTYAVARVQDPYGVLGRPRQAPLKIGTFVQAEIRGYSVDDAVALPRDVVRPDNTVLIANQQDQLEIRSVEVSRLTTDYAYVIGGLENGDQVITTAIAAPIPGMALRFKKDTATDSSRLAETEDSGSEKPDSSPNDQPTESAGAGGTAQPLLNARPE